MLRKPAVKEGNIDFHAAQQLSFVLAVIIGASLIFSYGMSSTFEASDKWVQIGLPVLVMVLYGVYWTVIYLRRGSIRELASFADNLYYLGFIFTLISLFVQLVLMKVSDPYAQFGVALATTIVGLVSRIVLVGLVRGEDRKRDEGALDILNRQMTTFGSRVEILGKGLETARDKLERQTKFIQDTLKGAAEEFAEVIGGTLTAAVGKVETQITASAEVLKNSTNDLADASKTTADALKGSAEKFTEVV